VRPKFERGDKEGREVEGYVTEKVKGKQ